MFAALQEAEKAFDEGEIPVGAVIVYQNKIIGKGYNQVEKLKDPTAHAEMIAITSASNHLNDWRLNECELFVTLEPCIMCTGAIIAARLNAVYFSEADPKFGACGSKYNLAEEARTNHTVKIFSGIYAEESKQLLQTFFSKLRNKKQF